MTMLMARSLVHAASLPMSVIIVGVGEEDFSAMRTLDGDRKRISADGMVRLGYD